MFHQQVIVLDKEPVQRNVQTIVQKCHIDTDIRLFLFFPSDGRCTSQTAGCIRSLTVADRREIKRTIRIVFDILVTNHTVTDTHFQTVKDCLVFHKRFIRHIPCSRERRQDTPTVAFGKLGRTVVTGRCRQVITQVIIVVHSTQNRNEGIALEI